MNILKLLTLGFSSNHNSAGVTSFKTIVGDLLIKYAAIRTASFYNDFGKLVSAKVPTLT